MRLVPVVLVAGALAGACREVPARRVEEARYLTVGGIEQWVTLRGARDRNPVLLLLHGGPGDVQSPLPSVYAPYERDFVLVQWDQRGAGRTFSRNGVAGLTLERQAEDGDRPRGAAAGALSRAAARPRRALVGQRGRDRDGAEAAGPLRRLRRHGPGGRLGRHGPVPVRLHCRTSPRREGDAEAIARAGGASAGRNPTERRAVLRVLVADPEEPSRVRRRLVREECCRPVTGRTAPPTPTIRNDRRRA